MLKCTYCEGTPDSHDAACPLHPDKVEQSDLRMLVEANSGFALHVRQVRALEQIAQHPSGALRRYAAECSRGDYRLGTGRTVLVLISAYSVEDAARQLALPQNGSDLRYYNVRFICPWQSCWHGPWVNSPSGITEQDAGHVPHTPVVQ